MYIMEYTYYKINCLDNSVTDFYIGSTKDYNRRKCQHKSRCNTNKGYIYKIYETIKNNGGWENWEMNAIDKQTFNSKIEAHIYERGLIDIYKPTLNKTRPYVTLEEKIKSKNELQKKWIEKNTDYMKNYCKKWRANKKAQQSSSLDSSSLS